MIARAAGFLALWLVLGGVGGAADLALGAATAALAAWASLRLAPPPAAIRPLGLLLLLPRLLPGILRAGWDVALLALDPRRAPRPGIVPVAPGIPPGPARDAFLTLSSLLPGTLPAGEVADGRVAIHALDLAQPVAAAMAVEEARCRPALHHAALRHG